MDLEQSSSVAMRTSRAAMGEHGLDALIVSGNEYTGFEGAVTYMSGFQIVHRYAYVVLPADGDAFVVFPTEARYVGEHGTTPLEQVFHASSGRAHRRSRTGAGWQRLGVYGLDYVMAVRDYQALTVSTSSRSTWSSTSPAPSRARRSSSPCATRCGSTSAASRSGTRTTRRARPRPR